MRRAPEGHETVEQTSWRSNLRKRLATLCASASIMLSPQASGMEVDQEKRTIDPEATTQETSGDSEITTFYCTDGRMLQREIRNTVTGEVQVQDETGAVTYRSMPNLND